MIQRATWAGFLIMLVVLVAPAQIKSDGQCPGQIYRPQDVTRRAKILEGPDVSLITQIVEPNVRGRVVLDAVLCRSGQVTDVRIIEGLSTTVNEFTTAAVRLVRFAPAELRWHSVSQRMRFEISFGAKAGIKVTTSADPTGRLVKSMNIVGHRRLTTTQILSWIQTRPGEPYSPEQIKRDFQAILTTGNFDKTQTRVTIEDGPRGGVVVTFMVVELRLIAEIKFEGLKIDRSLVWEAWEKEHVSLRPGGVYDVAAIKAAIRVLKQLLDANGQSNSRVETITDSLTSMTVSVTFVITPKR
jgi:hypothetical protein